jgi:hypothetical protein
MVQKIVEVKKPVDVPAAVEVKEPVDVPAALPIPLSAQLVLGADPSALLAEALEELRIANAARTDIPEVHRPPAGRVLRAHTRACAQDEGSDEFIPSVRAAPRLLRARA